MKRIVRNTSIILRTQGLIAQRSLVVAHKKLALVLFAGLVALLGLLMLNVAAYQALQTPLGDPIAALIVAVVNFIIAAGLMLWAGKANADAEIYAVTEVRDMAVADLEAELDEMKDEATAIIEDLRGIRRDPLGAMTSSLLLPLLSAILKSLRSDK